MPEYWSQKPVYCRVLRSSNTLIILYIFVFSSQMQMYRQIKYHTLQYCKKCIGELAAYSALLVSYALKYFVVHSLSNTEQKIGQSEL